MEKLAVEQLGVQTAYPALEAEMPLLEEQLRDILQPAMGELLKEVGGYLLTPGKRLRPALVLLSSLAAGGEGGQKLTPLGAAVELLHMATLIHDDIIDGAGTRRGRPSINSRYGSHIAVLMGDYCYGKSMELVAGYGDEYVSVMVEVINRLVAGELLQYESVREPYRALDNYWERINKKTAFFFSACCRLGAMHAGASPAVREILNRFGECLGMAFQIRDDLMDFVGDSACLGKEVGSDFRNGIMTLPLIHAVNFSRDSKLAQALLEQDGHIDYQTVMLILKETGALDFTRDACRHYLNLALQSLEMLPPSKARENLWQLAAQLGQGL